MKTFFLIPLIAGLGLLCACKGRKSSYSADSTTTESLSKAKNVSPKYDSLQDSPKLIKTADINFKVKSVQQTSEHIAALVENYNGMVVHHVMGATPAQSLDIRMSNDSLMRVTTFNSTAEMTVKIPPYKMEDFINQVSRMGVYVNNLRMDIKDKWLDYLAAKLKLRNRSESLGQQSKADQNNLLAYKDNLVDREIGNRSIEDSVKQSTITLSFYESNVIHKEIIANDNLSAYNQSFLKRLGLSIENGWDMFEDLFVALANAWILLPVAVLIWFIAGRYKVKKPIAITEA